MTPALFVRPNKKARSLQGRAFSLIEAAIVLGIVGLVIGGLWIAAARVNENRKQSEMSTGLGYLREKAREVFPAWSFPTTGSTQATLEGVAAGVFPENWINSRTTTNIYNAVRHPWGADSASAAYVILSLNAADASSLSSAVSEPSFMIEMSGLTRASCVNVLMNIINTRSNSGFYAAWTSPPVAWVYTPSTINSANVSLSNVQSTYCTAANGNTIRVAWRP